MNSKITRRALLTSVLAVVLCLTMLVGTTFAWFTDTVTSANNIIASGTLDVEMYYADGTKAVPADDSTDWIDASTGAIFSYDKWEPGYAEVRHIKIANEGTLALKYKVEIVANGEVSDLADVIDVYYVDPAVQVADRDALVDSYKLGTLTDVLAGLATTGHGTLIAGDDDTITLALKMQETAGNEYQDKEIGTSFSVQVYATQLTYEKDSFDNNYDAGASYVTNVSTSVKVDGTVTEDVVFETEGETVVTVEVPAEVINNLPAEVESVSFAHTDPVVDTTTNSVVFDSAEFVDQNGDAIDLSANTTPITVTLPVPFADGAIVNVYHDDEFVATVVVANGEISYKTLHFCTITVSGLKTVNVATEADLLSVEEGQIINLVADITLSGEVTLPANVYLKSNGNHIDGTIYAGGDLTIQDHVRVTAFSASYYNRVITIEEGACLEITGGGRVSLAYGNIFNITGTIDNAKTADKANVQPSLIIPAGISITGGSDATMNVKNAYIKVGGTSSKNSSANGTFELNFDNSIVEFTDHLTFAEPTSGKNPTFNVNIKDSVFTVAKKICVAAPNTEMLVTNSDIVIGTYLRNSGVITLVNSTLTGSTIQFGENGGNNGTIIVDGSEFTITASSTGHAFDGKDIGSIVAKNGAKVSVDYYKAMTIDCDTTSTFTGTEVK